MRGPGPSSPEEQQHTNQMAKVKAPRQTKPLECHPHVTPECAWSHSVPRAGRETQTQ